MNTQAFILNEEFVEEVWRKIQFLREILNSDKDFVGYVQESELFSINHLKELIETAYWVSHTTEERNPSNPSLMLVEPHQKWNTFSFDRPVRMVQRHLVKLGAALDSGFSDICLWPEENGELKIWGFKMRSQNHLTTNLRILILGPGSIVIMCYGRSIAALTGNKGSFLNPDCLFNTLMPKFSNDSFFDTKESQFIAINILLQISQAMKNHQKGGTLLFVPEKSGWESSIKQPVYYSGRAQLIESDSVSTPTLSRPPESRKTGSLLKMFIDPENKGLADYRLRVLEQCTQIGRLTAADGALVMSHDRYVLCFGAKIQALDALSGSTPVRVVKPVEGDIEGNMMLADLGGTRHLSAAQFVHDQPDAIAIVASQDGNMTFFTKDTLSGELLVVQDAELALMYEGVLGTFWNLQQFIGD